MELIMKDLIWEKGKPKKYGWYWICEDGLLDEPSAYDIEFFWPKFDGSKVIDVSCKKEAFFDNKNWWNNFWFAGPIPRPNR